MREQSMIFNGARVTYWTQTPSPIAAASRTASPPSVFLHGLGADHEGLWPLAARLPNEHIVSLDLPGFGRSEPLAGPHTFEAYAAVVEALCTHLGLSDVLIVGHSLGASIALTHAAIYPARVRALAMLMPVTSGAGPLTWLPRAYYRVGSWLPARAARMWFLSRAAVFVSDELTITTTDPSVRRRILREDYRTAALASPRAVQEIYRSIRRTPFVTLARQVRADTVILGAQRDALASGRSLALLHRQVPKSELVMVPDAGHLWPVERPDDAAIIIAAALRRLGLGTQA